MNKVYIFIALFGFFATLLGVNARCHHCQENGVSCVNRTSYQVCYEGNKAFTKQTFTCQEGMECTDLPSICFQAGGWAPSCGDFSNCGVCNAKGVFACTSRTTFKFCFGSDKPSDVKGFCPVGFVCDLQSKSICVQSNGNFEPSCDISDEKEMIAATPLPIIPNQIDVITTPASEETPTTIAPTIPAETPTEPDATPAPEPA